MIPLILVGAAGRMGQAIVQAAMSRSEFSLKGFVDLAANLRTSGGVWDSNLGALLERGDVVVEFSSPQGCRETARACASRGAALVTGTTGLQAEDETALRDAARTIVVVRASNFSLGVAALRRALSAALRGIPGWDIEIVERHHRGKADSPSGTALTLANDAAAARGLPAQRALRFGRQGRVGPRSADEIGVHAVRGGTWIGDHAVLLAGEGEWLELRHVAQDRLAFAHGALAAAEFAAGRKDPGLYDIEDVLESQTS
jgi:4-hydroxy-tetrahydrodipicolinate reductase